MQKPSETRYVDPVIAVHSNHRDAAAMVKTLGTAGFDMRTLSIVGKGYETEEHALGFISATERIVTWGATGGFWGAIWGLLAASGIFVLPPLELVAGAGPFLSTLVAALEGAIAVGGLSAMAAALVSLCMPKQQAIRYEVDIKAKRYLVLVQGSAADVARARAMWQLVQTASPDPCSLGKEFAP